MDGIARFCSDLQGNLQPSFSTKSSSVLVVPPWIGNSINAIHCRTLQTLRHGEIFSASNIISSIEFDRDEEFVATAGVCI